MSMETTAGSNSAHSLVELPRERSQTSQILRRFRRNVNGMLGLGMVLVVVVLSAGAPLLTHADPTRMDTSAILEPPSSDHLFGTDDLGRDVLSRVLHGGRISTVVAVVVGSVTTFFGIILGVLSGFYRRLDNPIMRAMDIVMSFPSVLLALAIVAILGPRLINVIVALIVPYTPLAARVVRAMVLQLKEKEFVLAARCVGATDRRIIAYHLLPNSIAPLLVQETYIIAVSILAEAYLSFLGVGVPPEVPTLGGMISEARSYFRYTPWLPVFPGVAISVLVLGWNLLGDGLRDVLDPMMKV